jgi:hypothetical protein
VASNHFQGELYDPGNHPSKKFKENKSWIIEKESFLIKEFFKWLRNLS